VAVEPLLSSEEISPAREAEAVELFRLAEEAFTDERSEQAVRLAERIVARYPGSTVSGRALRLLADAALAAELWEVADAAAERYAGLLPSGDRRAARMHLLRARAMAELDRPEARLERLLQVPADAPPEIVREAVDAVRETVRALERAEVESRAAGVPAPSPFAPALRAWYARLLLAEDRQEDAARWARMALTGGATGPDSALAAVVLDPSSGDLPPLPGPAVAPLGSILPRSGSPAFRDLAALIAEGVEVAVASAGPDLPEVQLLARDDAGDPGAVDTLVAGLEEAGALGAVGFLEDRTLALAAEAREGALPLVSPTARLGPDAPPGVFSLAGADPVAASAVARWAGDRGYQRAALIHSRVPESMEEARAIEATLAERGVSVVGSFPYDAGATFFEEQIHGALEVLRLAEIRALGLGEEDTLRVEELDPVALFVPVPAEDVEFLAPQITFFGVDTLGIDIYGTSGWTDGQTLETVDSRHTTGVVAVAPRNAGPGSRGYAAFREAYEEYFRRSLVSPVPALGYDAALLLLEAVGSGARTPAEVREALARIEDLEGATGTFASVDGRILRRQEVVRIVRGSTIPAN
jgi:ABC-type branched-subunit amino acid transport system substrate-binding protein